MQNKTLLAKIVGLIAVMCFALSMVFGLVGCGNAKTISKTSIDENGHLIVTYSDDTTEDLGSVIGPKGDKGETGEVHDCAHENSFIFDKCTLGMYNLMVGEENAADGDDFCYFELSVCKDCGYVTVEFTTNHVYAETTVAPTCTEEGYTGLVCTECGYAIEKTNIVPAKGHDYEIDYISQYADPNKSFCEDGGFVAAICKVCGDEEGEATFVRRLGHQSLNWEIKDAPTTEAPGTLTGICEVCGKAAATRTIPKLNKEYYSNEEGCSYELNNKERDNAKADYDNYVYSITVEFEEYAFDKTNNKIVKSVKLDEEGNKIAQTFTFSELQPHKTNNDKEYVGNAKIDNYYVGMDGIELFGNSGELTCQNKDEYIAAYFICDACGDLITVNVRGEHTPVPSTLKEYEATCTKNAYKEFDCSKCGEHIVEYDPNTKLDHAYEVISKELNGDKLTITLECTTCKAGDDGHEVTYTGSYTEETTKPATCVAEGTKTLNITTDDGKTYHVEVTIPKIAHTYKGVAIDEVNAYPVGTPGLEESGNDPATCDSGTGIIVCDACGKFITVNVRGPHTIVEGTLEEYPATCTEKAYKKFDCSVCGNKDIIEYTGPALGHDYVVNVDTKATKDATGAATITCSRCEFEEEFELPVIDGTNYVIDPEAACNAEGLGTYTYEKTLDNGDKVTITFTDVIESTDHKFVDGKDKIFTYTDEKEVTWKYTARLCSICGEYVIVSIEDISGRS